MTSDEQGKEWYVQRVDSKSNAMREWPGRLVSETTCLWPGEQSIQVLIVQVETGRRAGAIMAADGEASDGLVGTN